MGVQNYNFIFKKSRESNKISSCEKTLTKTKYFCNFAP